MTLEARVHAAVRSALGALCRAGKLGADPDAVMAAPWGVEKPKRPEHGDFSTNVAMVVTKRAGMPPRAIAELLAAELKERGTFAEITLAGPGFVNLRVRPSWVYDELDAIRNAGRGYGRKPAASGERIHLELVSANPTGPITVAAARNAVLGDAIGRLLEACGNRVTREYYINDSGRQVTLFAESVRARGNGTAIPEDGYQGEYVTEVANHLKSTRPDLLGSEIANDVLARECIAMMISGIPGSRDLGGIRSALARIGVPFDVWYSEESLHRWGRVDRVLADLRTRGFLEDKDGATFFVAKAKQVGEAEVDKDRAVKKSDGSYTYFASDIAYFQTKIERGYDRILIVLGADHHGYVTRIKNALEALSFDVGKFEAFLYQLVFILRAGEIVKSSKRAGNVITSDEIVEEIDEATGRAGSGSDALRFFFLSRTMNAQVDFDVEIAKKASLDNPVFYVQYGHARLCSILKRATDLGFRVPEPTDPIAWDKLSHPDELALSRRIAEFPLLVEEANSHREPHRVVFYVQELAREFQSYFTRMKTDPILPPESVLVSGKAPADWDTDKTMARLAWISAIRTVYREALGLLGVSAPERMERPSEEADDETKTVANAKT